MPKRNKKKTPVGGQDEHEGRPAELTLASFLNFPQLPSAASHASTAPISASLSGVHSKPEVEAEVVNRSEAEENDRKQCTNYDKVASTSSAFTISKTKKGKLPIALENRAKGKKVTVIGNVSGDARSLLSEIKRRTGSGGVIRDNTVELQGDHQKFLENFLSGHPCLRPYKS